MAEYKKVKIERGKGGWGGPLEVKPTDERKYVVCITGGGIHPVAQKIADMTGAEAFDGFKSSPEGGFKAMACAVIDCGGNYAVRDGSGDDEGLEATSGAERVARDALG